MHGIGLIKEYLYVSYAIHRDCKGHTGTLMTMDIEQCPVFQENKIKMQNAQQRQN